jgi:hypothetical protein
LIDLVLDIEPGPQSASHGDHGPHEVTWQSTTALLGWRQKEQAGKSSQVFLRWRRIVQAFHGFVYCAKFAGIVER